MPSQSAPHDGPHGVFHPSPQVMVVAREIGLMFAAGIADFAHPGGVEGF